MAGGDMLRDIPDFLNQIKMQLGFAAVSGLEPAHSRAKMAH